MITVAGMEPVTVTFAHGLGCCGVRTIDVTLKAGSHTLTISNPSDQAPSVDRIVLSRA